MTRCLSSAIEPMQRAVGTVRIEATGKGLVKLAQSGCLRACFPRRHGGALEAVIVNTAGGIADGDRHSIDVVASVGADVVVSTPSAERIYRARPGAEQARIATRLHVHDGARLAFLPQETILFEACALERTVCATVGERGTYLGVEALVFGRQESDETITRLRLRDTVRIRREGRLVLHDSIRLDGAVRPLLTRAASMGGARTLATVVYAAADAEALLNGTRDVLATVPAEGGASAWDGMLVTRLLAEDAHRLRMSLVAVLSIFRKCLPRTWN